jgi:hypothetical protein
MYQDYKNSGAYEVSKGGQQRSVERMIVQEMEPTQTSDGGLYAMEAEFFSEYLVVNACLSSPDMRLSDHLNGSAAAVEIRPGSVEHGRTGAQIGLEDTFGSLAKARVLFVIPIREPVRPPTSKNVAWKRTIPRWCWGSVGPYRFVGKFHTEADQDPRLHLRTLTQQFVPLTDVTLTFPDGSTRFCRVILFNRSQLDLLAIKDSAY